MIVHYAIITLVVGKNVISAADGCQFNGDMCEIGPECIEEKYRSYAMSDCYEVLDTAPLYQPGLSLSYLTYVDFAVVPDGPQPDDWTYTIYQREGYGTKTKLSPLEGCCNMKSATTDKCLLQPEKDFVAIFPTNEGFCEFRIIRDDKPLEFCEEGKDIDGACIVNMDGVYSVKYEYYLTADSKEMRMQELPTNRCYFTVPDDAIKERYEAGQEIQDTSGILMKKIEGVSYGYLLKSDTKLSCSIYENVKEKTVHIKNAYDNWNPNYGSYVCYGVGISGTTTFYPKPFCIKMEKPKNSNLIIALIASFVFVVVLSIVGILIYRKSSRKKRQSRMHYTKKTMSELKAGNDEEMSNLKTTEE